MSEKAQGALAAALACFSALFIALVVYGAWSRNFEAVAISLTFSVLSAIAATAVWSVRHD